MTKRKHKKWVVTGKESLMTITCISCEERLSYGNLFSDLFSDWLIKKGINITSEMLEDIEDCYTNAPVWIGKYQLGPYVIKKLKLPVKVERSDIKPPLPKNYMNEDVPVDAYCENDHPFL